MSSTSIIFMGEKGQKLDAETWKEKAWEEVRRDHHGGCCLLKDAETWTMSDEGL